MFAPLDVSDLARAWGMLALAVTLKGLVLLALALVSTQALRRGAASTRHFVWTASVAGMLALPLLGSALPGWSIPGLGLPVQEITLPSETARAGNETRPATFRVERLEPTGAEDWFTWQVSPEEPTTAMLFPVGVTEPAATNDVEPESAGLPGLIERVRASMRTWSPWVWALLAWELGVLLVAAWIGFGWWQAHRLERRAHPVADADWISAAEIAAHEIGLRAVPRLLRTDDAMTPLVWGLRRAKVLVPAVGDGWDFERRLDVLRHEFAHVQRRDVMTQLGAQIACALFWFHPLPWIAAARMRLERERACDDRVLLAGSRASSYAGHLLDMARSLRSAHGLAAATIGMARRSQLGERMDSLLDERPRGRATSNITRVVLTAGLLALVLPLAALRPDALEAAPPERDDDAVRFFPAPPAPPVAGSVTVHPAPRTLWRRADGIVAPAPRLFANDGANVRLGRGGFSFTTGGRMLTGDDDLEIEGRHMNWSFNDDELELEVESHGRIRFLEDESDVELLDDRSYFDLRWEEGRDRHRMEIERDRDGDVTRTYYRGGRETDIDDEARTWFARALSTFMMQAGLGVENRVDRWIEAEGVEGAIDRVEAIPSDHAAGAHWRELLRRDDLSEEQRAAVLEAIAGSIESDFEKVLVLDGNMGLLRSDGAVGARTLGLIGSIDSDFERRRALGMALQLGDLDEATLDRILVLIDGMDSDFEKANVLTEVLREGKPNRSYFQVLRGVDSDFEKTRVLIDALPLALDDPEARAQMWATIEEIDSDFEKARLIGALAPKLDGDEAMVLEAMDVIETIDSDFEKARVLGEFVEPAVRWPAVRERFDRVAGTIESDHEYGRLMRELQRAER